MNIGTGILSPSAGISLGSWEWLAAFLTKFSQDPFILFDAWASKLYLLKPRVSLCCLCCCDQIFTPECNYHHLLQLGKEGAIHKQPDLKPQSHKKRTLLNKDGTQQSLISNKTCNSLVMTAQCSRSFPVQKIRTCKQKLMHLSL